MNPERKNHSFGVRLVLLPERHVESLEFDTEPDVEQARRICDLMANFLSNREPSFRDRIGFMKHGEWTLDWNAGPGGVAFAGVLHEGDLASVAVLRAGLDAAASAGVWDAFKESFLERAFGPLAADEEGALGAAEGANIVIAMLPGKPELVPALQLINTALAAVFFRTVLTLHEQAG